MKGILKPRFNVRRTIWPYTPGWGVAKEQLGHSLTVVAQGLSKQEAETYATILRKESKEKHK